MSAASQYILLLSIINAIGAWSVAFCIRGGLLSASHAAIAGAGGYAAGWTILHANNYFLAWLAGIGVGIVIALVLGLATVRIRGLLAAVATLVLGEALIASISGIQALGGNIGLTGLPLRVGLDQGIVALAVVIVLGMALHKTRLSIQLPLLANSRDVLASVGSQPTSSYMIMMAVSGAVAGIAGVLNAFSAGLVQPSDLAIDVSLTWLIYAVVGGAFSNIGPIVVALAMTEIELQGGLGEPAQLIVNGAVLIVVLVVRPGGLLSRHSTRLVDTGRRRGLRGAPPSGFSRARGLGRRSRAPTE
jgi:branched-chain amino acid transport system permease protein